MRRPYRPSTSNWNSTTRVPITTSRCVPASPRKQRPSQAYFAERFRLLRKLLFAEGEEAFVRSLSQSVLWTPQVWLFSYFYWRRFKGGKSGSFFYKTQDDRFIMKQMGSFEIKSFLSFAPNYFEYIKTAVTENKLTTLCKVSCLFERRVYSPGVRCLSGGSQEQDDPAEGGHPRHGVPLLQTLGQPGLGPEGVVEEQVRTWTDRIRKETDWHRWETTRRTCYWTRTWSRTSGTTNSTSSPMPRQPSTKPSPTTVTSSRPRYFYPH